MKVKNKNSQACDLGGVRGTSVLSSPTLFVAQLTKYKNCANTYRRLTNLSDYYQWHKF